MNTITKQLAAAQPPEPLRPLSADFTQQVMQHLPQKRFRRIDMFLAHIPSRLKTSLAVATLAIGISATGSYAASLWLAPHVALDQAQGITTLANGDKRFWLTFSSCQGQEAPQPQKYYYEIKANSSLTIEQLSQGLVVSCEADLLTQLFPEIATEGKGMEHFKPYQTQYYTPYAKVVSTTKQSITVSLNFNGVQYTSTLPINANARFYEKGQGINLNSLHAGDWLTLVTETHALAKPFATETLPPSEILSLTDHGMPIGSTVLGAIKHIYNPEMALTIETSEGKDWTRLTPDKHSPDGWAQVVPMQ